MEFRKRLEQLEEETLSPYGAKSSQTKGRLHPEEACDMRTDYQRDRDRILHSKSFRRLKHKTQVFLEPQGDHYRTRLTHTLEVSQIARSISKALLLNEDLTEAIALGHDLGHTPFGHAGERVLNQVCQGGFVHNQQSLRVVDYLEKDGQGLNLTWEVRDGILNHQMRSMPATLEGKVVRLSDKIAYINHDTDDAIRGGILKETDIPLECRQVLGMDIRSRLNTLIHDIVQQSEGKNDILMSQPVEEAMTKLRQFMLSNVYTNPIAKGEEYKVKSVLGQLYAYYLGNIRALPDEYRQLVEKGEPAYRVVCDYIAGMSDQYAVSRFQELFIPKPWLV
jgi:dGTPase